MEESERELISEWDLGPWARLGGNERIFFWCAGLDFGLLDVVLHCIALGRALLSRIALHYIYPLLVVLICQLHLPECSSNYVHPGKTINCTRGRNKMPETSSWASISTADTDNYKTLSSLNYYTGSAKMKAIDHETCVSTDEEEICKKL